MRWSALRILRRMGASAFAQHITTLSSLEGFFGHMKDEFYRGRRFDSFEAFESELAAYIHYWNNQRYQVGLKGMTPVQYRGHSIRAA